MCQFLTYPKEIQKIFLFEQVRQTRKEDVNVFLNYYGASKQDGGFSWSSTLYAVKLNDANVFRDAVSLRISADRDYKHIINFYKTYIPDLVEEQTETIEVDGITVVL